MDKKASKVRVVIRLRPLLSDKDSSCVSIADSKVQIFNHRNVNENIEYDFSAVYGMNSTQREIYTDCVYQLLPKSLSGQNISIFAYGPTGAGKTHTMLGTASEPGIIPRVINGLFEQIEEDKKADSEQCEYKVAFSYLEIYNEKVQDLLEPSASDLPIRENADKNILVPGLARKEIHNYNEFNQVFGPATNNRKVGATKLNERSSRSHSIIQLIVKKKRADSVLHGKIYLIDLAGSEDNRRTGNQGIRLKESGAINKSLFALGEVVDAINSSLPRIPYRNSKLTRLLQDSIGGSCHSVMITNIAPEERHYYDTYCTLNFASKSKKIVNNTVTKATVTRAAVGIVKPQPKRTPTTSKDREASVSNAKRPRLDSSIESDTESVASLLSPLDVRQEQFEATVNKRLAELESNLITEIKSFKPSQDHIAAGLMTPKTKALQDMQQQLAISNAKLKELATQHNIPLSSRPSAPANLDTASVRVKPTSIYTDILKSDASKVSSVAVKPERPISGIKRKKVEEFSCSPLFRAPAKTKKRAFVSTASSEHSDDEYKENISMEQKVCVKTEDKLINSVSQLKRNEEFLAILNTSSVKDLQSLQTVGPKRAKLIYEWRETCGHFKNASDLMGIPGFTEKYFHKLMLNNLVTAT